MQKSVCFRNFYLFLMNFLFTENRFSRVVGTFSRACNGEGLGELVNYSGTMVAFEHVSNVEKRELH